MIRPIVKDPLFLARKSLPATKADEQIAKDLMETLIAHRDGCVGMAANMIGELKRIIVVDFSGTYLLMYNPEITKKSGPYDAEEGCLSLSGVQRTTRYENITVRFRNKDFKQLELPFSGWTAQIIQHEVDHLEGILI